MKRMAGLCALDKLLYCWNYNRLKKIFIFINKISSVRGKCSNKVGCSQPAAEHLSHIKTSMCRSSEQEWGQTAQPHQLPNGPSQQAPLHTQLSRHGPSTSYLSVAGSQLCFQKGEKLCMKRKTSFSILLILRLD